MVAAVLFYALVAAALVLAMAYALLRRDMLDRLQALAASAAVLAGIGLHMYERPDTLPGFLVAFALVMANTWRALLRMYQHDPDA